MGTPVNIALGVTVCGRLYKKAAATPDQFKGVIMDRETKIGFVCMFTMVFCAIGFPILLKTMGAW